MSIINDSLQALGQNIFSPEAIASELAVVTIVALIKLFKYEIRLAATRIRLSLSKKEQILKEHEMIVPVDHGEPYYIYNERKRNLELDISRDSFFIPPHEKGADSPGKWTVFDSTSTEDEKTAIERLRTILKEALGRKGGAGELVADPRFMEDEFERLLSDSRKEAMDDYDPKSNDRLYAVKHIALNRLGKDESPWCLFTVFETDHYTRAVMHILFEKLFGEKALQATDSIVRLNQLYPFIYGLVLDINLISTDKRSNESLILKKDPIRKDMLRIKDPGTKWSMFCVETIGPEDLSNNEIDLKDTVEKKLVRSKILNERSSIRFSDIFFVKQEMNIEILTEVKVEDYELKSSKEISLPLATDKLFDHLKTHGSEIKEDCRYSLTIWISRGCINDALERVKK